MNVTHFHCCCTCGRVWGHADKAYSEDEGAHTCCGKVWWAKWKGQTYYKALNDRILARRAALKKENVLWEAAARILGQHLGMRYDFAAASDKKRVFEEMVGTLPPPPNMLDLAKKIRAARAKMREIAATDLDGDMESKPEAIEWLLQDMPNSYGGPMVELLDLCDQMAQLLGVDYSEILAARAIKGVD